MNLELLRNEIWKMLGEPTDLNPASDIQYNGGPLLTFVANEGQREIAMWTDPINNQPLRLDVLWGEFYFQTQLITGELTDQTGATATSIVLPVALCGGESGRYQGWIVKVGGETKLITNYNVLVATLETSWSTQPVVGDTFTLYKRFYYLVPADDIWVSENILLPPEVAYRSEGNLLKITKLEDTVQKLKLAHSPRVEDTASYFTSVGTPTQWWQLGNRVYFDSAFDDERWLRAEYYRLPKTLVNAGNEPEIPEYLHYGIVLWGIWWGYRRLQESTSAYSAKLDWEGFMRRITKTYDIASERENAFGVLQRR